MNIGILIFISFSIQFKEIKYDNSRKVTQHQTFEHHVSHYFDSLHISLSHLKFHGIRSD